MLFVWAVAGLLIVADLLIFGADGARILAPLWGLATALPVLAVTARRLHDYDLSGWWMLLAVVPVFGMMFVLWVVALRGTDGPNRFDFKPLE